MLEVRLHLIAKSLIKLPNHVVVKLNLWVSSVEKFGLREVRKVPGYHDEPLVGKRRGQRSVRLTKAYRLIYSEFEKNKIEVVLVEEVNKHEY